MPNWCQNEVSIIGSWADVALAVAAITKDDHIMTFEKFLPRPAGLDGGAACDWSSSHWGTKWDVGDDVTLEMSLVPGDTDHAVAYTGFETAWSPPLAFFHQLSQTYPNVAITVAYDEAGADFSGRMTFRHGIASEEEEGPSKQREEWESTPRCDTCGVEAENVGVPNGWCGECGNCADHCEQYEGCPDRS